MLSIIRTHIIEFFRSSSLSSSGSTQASMGPRVKPEDDIKGKNFGRSLICFLCFLGLANAEPIPIKISLDWLLNPHHAPLVIGIENGYFKEQGLDVQLIGSVGSLEGCKQVAASNVEFALILEPQWLIQNAQGLVLKPICTLIPKPLEVFVSRVPLSELKGKRIGHCSSGVGFSIATLKEILSQQNINLEDVELIYTKQSLAATFIAGQIDAVTNIYRTYGIYDIKKHLKDFNVYPLENLGVPSFAAMIVVSNPNMDPTIAQKLIAALKKACAFLKEHPDQAWEIFKKHKLELDTEINAQVWHDVIAVFGVEEVDTKGPHHQALKDFLEKHGLVK